MKSKESESWLQDSLNELASQRKQLMPERPRTSSAIRKKLPQVGVELTDEHDALPTDLGDIFTIALIYTRIIQKLLAIKRGKRHKKEIRSLLRLLENELYIHLPYHLKSLKKPLRHLIDDLTE